MELFSLMRSDRAIPDRYIYRPGIFYFQAGKRKSHTCREAGPESHGSLEDSRVTLKERVTRLFLFDIVEGERSKLRNNIS